jgi:DNA-binding NarL/FixJ family response regulator
MKVLLVDDHPLFLDGLKNLLTSRGVQVVGIARDGWEAQAQARALEPDVILMDIQMPNCNGLTATRLIKAEMPNIKIVMLTLSSEDDDLFEAIKCGAFGYLLKSQDTDEFLDALDMVERGETPLSHGLVQRILQEMARLGNTHETSLLNEKTKEDQELSVRQLQILTLVAQGLTYKQVGAKLNLTERTIKYHMGEIVQRLHLENRAQVVAYAKQQKLCERDWKNL